MNYPDGLRFLYSLADFERSGRFSDRPDLEPVRTLLQDLDNPQEGRTTLHIAGSKGKGSVAAMSESVLRQAGLRTGLFTSPHLHRFPERIQIDGEPVSKELFAEGLTAVAAALERVRAKHSEDRLVTFDLLTALGFYLFRSQGVEAQVIEVGLGGLLDSTNVLEAKDCSVITNIGLEHREILGDTVAEIARQKAGIIRGCCPTVMAPQRESAADTIREVSSRSGSALIEVAKICNLKVDSTGSESQKFHLRTPSEGYQITLPLVGRHQLDNAASAVVAMETLAKNEKRIDKQSITHGIESVSWPARIETIKQRPRIVVDAAHTADSARVLADALADYLRVQRATLVIGLMGDKDLEGLIYAVEPLSERIIATQADHPRALPASEISTYSQNLGLETYLEPNLEAALDMATNLSTPSSTIVILGSVALAGQARAHILGLDRDPAVT